MSSDKITYNNKRKKQKEIIHMLETAGKNKDTFIFAEVLNKRAYFTLIMMEQSKEMN